MRELIQRGDDALPLGGVEIIQTIELKPVEPRPEDAA